MTFKKYFLHYILYKNLTYLYVLCSCFPKLSLMLIQCFSWWYKNSKLSVWLKWCYLLGYFRCCPWRCWQYVIISNILKFLLKMLQCFCSTWLELLFACLYNCVLFVNFDARAAVIFCCYLTPPTYIHNVIMII